MKRLLLATGLILATAPVFVNSAHAVPVPDLVIDCAADTDPSKDNTNEYWADYSGGTITVLTTNCVYSCAFGSTDQNASCGAAHFDNLASRLFTVSGPSMIHAYSPGSYGEEVFFGTTAEELNFQAAVNGNSIEFTWNEIPFAGVYSVLRGTGPTAVVCSAEVGETSCAFEGPVPKNPKTFTMNVYFDFTEAFKTQNDVASVEVVAATTTTTDATTTTSAEEEVLADSGASANRTLVVALLLLMAGLAATSYTRRRSARS